MASSTAVLFVLIGWAQRYDGTEMVQGAHRYLKFGGSKTGEAKALLAGKDGRYVCGAGRGKINETDLDVVLVARHPSSTRYEVIAVYRNPSFSVGEYNWITLKASSVIAAPWNRRKRFSKWPAGQGMRRWAKRIESKGKFHSELLSVYRSALSMKPLTREIPTPVDEEMTWFEGELRERFARHRKREAAFRARKIEDSLSRNKGRLRCEVPNCGFDFNKKYGDLGRNFAVVHHLRPLSKVDTRGSTAKLSDLAIVCANCHAMIHRGGACRSLKGLIPTK